MWPTTEPCDVCGEIKNNKIDSWFLHVVCEDHIDVSPSEAGKAKERRLTGPAGAARV